MASKPTPTAYAKPPNYLAEELKQRRQFVGLFLMGMYKAYGWRQPGGDEWLLEVRTWTTALAFIPTRDLLVACEDALAQPTAPKPITPDYVKAVYNGLPGQGLVVCSDPSHIPYDLTPPAPPLALPAGPGELEAITYGEYAATRAEDLAANILDPELRGVFGRLMERALLPVEMRARNSQGAPYYNEDGTITEAGVEAGLARLPGALAAFNEEDGLEDAEGRVAGVKPPSGISPDDLPGPLRDNLRQRQARVNSRAATEGAKKGLSGRDYLEQLRQRADLPPDIMEGVLNPRRPFLEDQEEPTDEPAEDVTEDVTDEAKKEEGLSDGFSNQNQTED